MINTNHFFYLLLKSTLVFSLVGVLIPSLTFADSIEKSLKSNDAYISPISKKTNEVTYNANILARDAIQGKKTSIPSSWRFVNAVAKVTGDYILFFQDKDGSVHTINISSNGNIDGADLINIPSHP